MKKKLIGFTLGRKKINLEAHVVPKWCEWLGLMFRRREKARALLFEFKKPVRMAIHSYFVFFPFVAIWVDSHNKVIAIKRVEPFKFRVLPSEKFIRLIEVPVNTFYNSLKFPSDKERFK
ncbi:DUF192 domain-containing protein [Candidatus Pacearchaeota archaeon]|nr:DUF192 domain-containing protein [Candidatus Pacearchaeota archaeon]